MTEEILKAARELGIESCVSVVEDHQVEPLVSVIVGTHAVQGRINIRWFLDGNLQPLKTILSDMHRLASNN